MSESGVMLIDRIAFDRMELTEYVRKEAVKATRIGGPFVLRTDVGDVLCEDGYAVIDSTGRLTAWERKLFERTFSELIE